MQNKTKIVGILNLTPDSFSGDGTQFFSANEAVDAAIKLAEDGADIIDIGAESTRPNANEISDYEEILRLQPVLKALKTANFKTPISIDTRKYNVAKKACELGIDYLNDVSGFADERMIDLVKEYNLKAIFMHSLTVPVQPEITLPENCNIVAELINWAEKKLELFTKKNIKSDRLIFDAGIGFGKTKQQNLEIIKNIEKFKKLGIEILIGHSEKSFLTLFTDLPAAKRNVETNAVTGFLASKGVDYVRVHNTSDAKRVINITNSLKATSKNYA